jgi:hypothetical protein
VQLQLDRVSRPMCLLGAFLLSLAPGGRRDRRRCETRRSRPSIYSP